jgi:anaerobic selenocysteine-containing dehydrogenase
MQVKGCCPLDCQDSCAWTAEVEDGKVTRIAGVKAHPITRGVLCAKVKDYEQRVTAPHRLLYPLKRTGPKGSGQFERISWDEALDEVAQRFRSIIAEHGAEALLPFSYLGTQGTVQRLALLRIFHALGASLTKGGVCAASALVLMGEGHPIGIDPEETPDARLILLWGQNVLTTCHHQWHFIEEARKRGAKLVAIDPCRTRTTRLCDLHLAPIPGSDAVLAAAIGRHLLETGRADLALARLWASDIDAYAQAVQPWSFAKAAEATGLKIEEISALAELFASSSPALIRAGVAPQQAENGEAFVRGLSALAILGGHWRHRGGGLSTLALPDFDESPARRMELLQGSPRVLDNARLGETLELDDPPVKGLMVWSANPAVSQIDSPRIRKGLAREDLFTVVIDHFLTDTARFADIVLPATTQFEHFDVLATWGHHYLMVNMPAIAPSGETRSSGDIMRALAPRLGLYGPAFEESDEEIAASVLPHGWTFSELKEKGWKKLVTARPAIAARQQPLRLADGAIAATPKPKGALLQLLTPKSHYFLNSTFANMARHRAAQGAPRITMNPQDARARQLDPQFRVIVRRADQQIEVELAVSESVRSGLVTLEGKWWDEGLASATPLNRLTASHWSPAGEPCYNETWVSVEQAKPESKSARSELHGAK